jgi:hypothetical protein
MYFVRPAIDDPGLSPREKTERAKQLCKEARVDLLGTVDPRDYRLATLSTFGPKLFTVDVYATRENSPGLFDLDERWHELRLERRRVILDFVANLKR